MVALFSTLAGLVVNFPDYQHNLDVLGLSSRPWPHGPWQEATMKVIKAQIAHPFERNSEASNTTGAHTEKLAYRLSMPVVGYVLGLSLGKLILLQQLCGVMFLGLVSVLAHQATGDKVCATLVPVGFAFCMRGKPASGTCSLSSTEWPTLRSLQPCLFGIPCRCFLPSLLLVGLTSEQSWCHHWLFYGGRSQNRTGAVNGSFRSALIRNPAAWAVVAAVAAYGIGRIWLGHVWDIRQTHSDISFSVARSQWPIFLVGLASGLEWFWVLLVFGALSGFLAGMRRLAGSFIGIVVCYLVACSTVYDTTRSRRTRTRRFLCR